MRAKPLPLTICSLTILYSNLGGEYPRLLCNFKLRQVENQQEETILLLLLFFQIHMAYIYK
jgi:hypothetical protein